MTFEEALDLIVNKVGINTAYWSQKKNIAPYFEALMVKIAEALNR